MRYRFLSSCSQVGNYRPAELPTLLFRVASRGGRKVQLGVCDFKLLFLV
jgi:hypothetical protein